MSIIRKIGLSALALWLSLAPASASYLNDQPFTPGVSYATPLSVSTSSANVALPSGTVVNLYNVGAADAYCKLGSSSVAATTSDDFVPAGGSLGLNVGGNTYAGCLTASGSTTINISGGSGIPSNTGGFPAAAQGAAGTGISQPSGGAGILGWLSGLYERLGGVLKVGGNTPVVVKSGSGSIPNTTSAYSANYIIGGVVTIATGLPNTTFAATVIRVKALVTNITGSPGLVFTIFDTSPAGTYGDGAVASPATADLISQRLSSNVALSPSTGNTGFYDWTFTGPRITTDSSGNLYFVVAAGASMTPGAASAFKWDFDGTE